MSSHVNFQNFINSFVTLLRCSTGEAWNSIMFETSWQRSILYQCNPDETYDTIVEAGRDPDDWRGPQGCGSYLGSSIFFNLFLLFVSQIYLNVVIAVIVDAFGGSTSISKLPFSDRLIDAFIRLWAKYDPDATCFISIEKLDCLLEDLGGLQVANDLFVYQKAVETSTDFR